MMMTVILLVAALLLVGAGYVLYPVVAYTYRKFKSPKTVRCPETGRPAAIQLDASHAALSATVGEPDLKLLDCSRWPQRQDCDQGCLKQIA